MANTQPTPDVYDNPLVTRYCSPAMAARWGPRRKIQLWRRLWLALAEAQAELGLTDAHGQPRIRPEQLDALRRTLDDIDLARAAEHERRLRHDVMAHIHAWADICPEARDILHLGATSCFVTDNADLILLRESLQDIHQQLVRVIDALARFAERYRATPTLGYTHYQPAQLTTVGKRACLWCYDFVLDLRELTHRLELLPFRGVKGTTGTQASFLALFHGDHDRVRMLDRLVAHKMGFDRLLPVSGQTYTRKIDTQILDALAGIAQSAHKWGTDLRLLAHDMELDEPFEREQVGSSAMAYKRNPMRAERMCSLARVVMGLPAQAAQTAATQWLERTLDDSACRRIYLPQACLGTDAILRLARNLAGGLIVNEAIIAQHVAECLPYMATENLLMAAVARGADRQAAHELIRQASQAVTAAIKQGVGRASDLAARLAEHPEFAGVDILSELTPERFVGRAPAQVDEFISQIIQPLRMEYADILQQTTDPVTLEV